MSYRKSSALSDLIRAATNAQEAAAEPVDPTRRHSVDREGRPIGHSPPRANMAPEELAEAFFPGSSLRGTAFFPKSLTHGGSLLPGRTSHWGPEGGSTGPSGWPQDASNTRGQSPPHAREQRASHGTAGSHLTAYLMRQEAIAEDHAAATSLPEGAANRSVAQGAAGSVASGGGESWSWQGRSPRSLEQLLLQQQQRHPGPGHFLGQTPQRMSPFLPGGVRRGEQRQAVREAAGPGGPPRGGAAVQSVAAGAFASPDRPAWAMRPAGGSGPQGADLTEPLLGRASEDREGEAAHAHSVSAAAPRSAIRSVSSATAAAAAAEAAAAAAGSSAGERSGSLSTSPKKPQFPPSKGGLVNAVVFGVINAVVSMPTLIAYAAIVFKAPLYGPYLDSLCRFFFFSSAIHQLVFVLFSSLPFAIGQVQDVGLIFLSAMASDIALRLTGGDGEGGEGGGGAGEDVGAVALGSSLLVMTVCTAVVGLLTMLVAHLKLADMVSYVPLPVVGGYLGFVGYFCIAGGTALAAGVQIDTLSSWLRLASLDALTKLLPTAATIAATMLTVEHCRHPLALPALIAAVPLAFHGVLWAAGWSLADAQATGWVMPPTAGSTRFWELWGLFHLQHGGLAHGVSLPAMLAQLPKLAGLFLVVCFGSCMDVAAIQSDMPTPLDFNRELMTVGISNLVTGAVGAGYTGSYIFSQTVFTMRQGIFHRANGLAVVAVELAVFALPFSVVQYMPNFYFGALLVWFGIEISKDWLVLSYKKLSRPEYVLLWLTFLAICGFGLELGIGAGVVMATLFFASQYARSQVSGLRQVAARSGRTHVYDTSSTLDLLGRRMAVLRLSGYVFFGSSTGLGNSVLQLAARMLQERAEERQQHEDWAMEAQLRRNVAAGGAGSGSSIDGGGCRGTPLPIGPGSGSSSGRQESAALPIPSAGAAAAAALAPAAAAVAVEGPRGAGGGGGGIGAQKDGEAEEEEGAVLGAAERHWCAAHALALAPVVIILDFGGVTGLDSTAARSFSTLVLTLSSQHVNVIFANVRRPDVRKLLAANGLPLVPYTVLQYADAGGERDGGDASAGGARASNGEGAVAAAGAGGGGGKPVDEEEGVPQPDAETALARPPSGGCWVFPSASVAVRACEDGYLALAGRVGLLEPGAVGGAASLGQLLSRHLREVFPSAPGDLGGLVGALEGALRRRQLRQGEVLLAAGAAVRHAYIIEQGAVVEEEHFEGGVRVGSREHGPGVVVGALEFFLAKPAPATLRVSSATCQLLVLGHGALGQLMAEQPRALAALQVLLMRSAYLDLASAQEAAHHGEH